MIANDMPRDCEAKAGPDAIPFPGESGIECSGQLVRRHAAARIPNRNLDRSFVLLRSYFHHSISVDRLHGVAQQVHECLMDPSGIALNGIDSAEVFGDPD